MNLNRYIFLDFDGVMATSTQHYSNRKKWHPTLDCYRFDEKCVKILNSIIEITTPIIIVSSDWKNQYTIKELNQIFEWNSVNAIVTDITPDLWGDGLFTSVSQLEECRATEILQYVEKHDIHNFVAIDDLNLSEWIPNNFVHTPRANEGIKQSGIKEKVLKTLNHQNMEYTDIMLDLETMGNKSNCPIVSIGAVEFNLETGDTGRKFYDVIDLQSCLDWGLMPQASTIYWWLQQNEKARNRICANGGELSIVLKRFEHWLNDCIVDVRIWGNGVRFDLGILEDAYVACKMKIPWNFRKEMDVRTLVNFAPEIKNNTPFSGIMHDPIDDCMHQILYCHAIWKHLNNK